MLLVVSDLGFELWVVIYISFSSKSACLLFLSTLTQQSLALLNVLSCYQQRQLEHLMSSLPVLDYLCGNIAMSWNPYKSYVWMIRKFPEQFSTFMNQDAITQLFLLCLAMWLWPATLQCPGGLFESLMDMQLYTAFWSGMTIEIFNFLIILSLRRKS